MNMALIEIVSILDIIIIENDEICFSIPKQLFKCDPFNMQIFVSGLVDYYIETFVSDDKEFFSLVDRKVTLSFDRIDTDDIFILEINIVLFLEHFRYEVSVDKVKDRFGV